MTREDSVTIFDQQGNKVSQLTWPAKLKQLIIKPTVVHQVVTAYAANRRQATAHTKNRSEVAGGGKKPWRQKGTGRARHGSIRSPLWVGGGVVFGPRKNRNYTHRLPDKLKSQATAMVIKDYFTTGHITVIDKWPTADKTKAFARLLSALKLTSAAPYLVLLTQQEKPARRGLCNLAAVEIMGTKQFNPYDGLRYRHWLLSAAAAQELLSRLG